jgi:plasmid stabilization system protein ParE
MITLRWADVASRVVSMPSSSSSRLTHIRDSGLASVAFRRIAVFPYPYLIFYRVLADDVVIQSVRHAARDSVRGPG